MFYYELNIYHMIKRHILEAKLLFKSEKIFRKNNVWGDIFPLILAPAGGEGALTSRSLILHKTLWDYYNLYLT